MQLTIHLPNRDEVLASNRKRWAEVHADRFYAETAYRVETNGFGEVIVSPPASGPHSSKASEIAYLLRSILGGRGLTECPISTIDGVRAADAGWYSDERYAAVRGQLVFETAPEICVEVLSPRNTAAEMQHKRTLHFDAGAEECWVCDLEGNMTYHTKETPNEPKPTSPLCPHFPQKIEDLV